VDVQLGWLHVVFLVLWWRVGPAHVGAPLRAGSFIVLASNIVWHRVYVVLSVVRT
jgi:hypothetical protein